MAQSTTTPALPIFSPRPDLELWELGMREYWPELETLLNGFDRFYVVDARTDAHSRYIARKFDESRGDIEEMVIHCVLGNTHGGDNHELLKRLLALGVHPDLRDKDGYRPSHCCGMFNRKACAGVLAACRPDLSAKNHERKRPFDFRNGRLVWGNLLRIGSPCLAQLAHDQKWWAIKNLCRRRRVIPDNEVAIAYCGRTAVQWTEHHGQMSLANEMRYLLGLQQPLSIPSSVQQKLNNEDTPKYISVVQERQEQFKKEFEEQLRGIKEAVSTCVSDIGKVNGKLANIETCAEMKERNSTEDNDMKIQQVEKRLLSSMQQQEDCFNNQLELLKEMIIARESIVDTQLKSIQNEVAQLAASVNSLVSTAGSSAACSQQSGTTDPSRSTNDASNKEDVVKELLALAKKLGG